MKKVLFAVMAMIAIGFTSCGNKAQQAADATEAAAFDVEAAVSEMTSQLSEQIEAQDAGKFAELLATVQEKIKEIIGNNPEAAKDAAGEAVDAAADKAKEAMGL